MKMKVKQILEIIKVISGERLPYDMEELNQQLYTSESQNKDYTIDDMDIIHFVRSFIKMQSILAEEVRRDTQEGRVVSQDNQIFKLEKRVSELLEEAQRLVKSKIKLKEKLAESVSADVYEMLFDKCERLQERIEELIPKKASPYYTFYEIPNDCEGQEFMDNLKKYLNKDRYKLRARGQYLDKSKLSKGESWRDYERGQPIDKSTHIRVYIDEKKEEK
jgi:DNA-binding transcriptional MerR regulator